MYKVRGSVRRASSTMAPKTKAVSSLLFPCCGGQPHETRALRVGDILDIAEQTQSFEVDAFRMECFLRSRPVDRKKVDGTAIGPSVGISRRAKTRVDSWKTAITVVSVKTGVKAVFVETNGRVIAKMVADIGSATKFMQTWCGHVSWPNLN